MTPRVIIDFGLPLHHYLGPDDAAVVVDVMRATTTAVTAVARGFRCLPVPSLDAAYDKAQTLADPLLAGDVRGRVPDGFDLGNSPACIARRDDRLRPLVLLSPSGTPLLDHVAHVTRAGAVYLACLRNVSATVEAVRQRYGRVVVIGAASQGEFRDEDRLCCARIAGGLVRAGWRAEDALTADCIERWSAVPSKACLGSRSVEHLRRSRQVEDLRFILRHLDDLAAAFALVGDEVFAFGEAELEAEAITAAT